MAPPRLIPLASYARLHALLGPSSNGQIPQVISEERQIMTGVEARVLTVRTGRGDETQTYMGPSMTGVGVSALKAERQRLQDLSDALKEAQKELEGVLAFIEGR